ncbi:hypothetical protein [Natronolimnohabitans innermongolicus]|uniref:hypothetical protein n=1 Tax=Natronolimnohabitans innermongolicus TaxID=253107 RepID=UPI0013756D53|nr:hypothetical protein [Natronolimnohabitans innermongolicus]
MTCREKVAVFEHDGQDIAFFDELEFGSWFDVLVDEFTVSFEEQDDVFAVDDSVDDGDVPRCGARIGYRIRTTSSIAGCTNGRCRCNGSEAEC